MSLQNPREGIWTPEYEAFQVRYNRGHLECRHGRESYLASYPERIAEEIQNVYGLSPRPVNQADDPYYVYFN